MLLKLLERSDDPNINNTQQSPRRSYLSNLIFLGVIRFIIKYKMTKIPVRNLTKNTLGISNPVVEENKSGVTIIKSP